MLCGVFARRSLNNLVRQCTLLRTKQLTLEPSVSLATRSLTVHSLNQNNLLTKYNGSVNVSLQRRFKKKKPAKPEKRDDSDDEEESDDDDLVDDEVVGVGFEDRVIDVNANRFDTIFRGASRLPRAQIDSAFFENRIRVNGYILTKKSEMASTGDVIDMIKGRNIENPENLDVLRVEILNIPDVGTNTGRLKIKTRFFKKLTIENYTEDPFEGASIATEKSE